MASTKEMMARAKARKAAAAQPQNRIDVQVFLRELAGMTKALFELDRQQDYNESAAMTAVSDVYIERLIENAPTPLNSNDLQQLLELRDEIETLMKARYGVTLPTGLSAMACDIEAILKDAGVPQSVRIQSGLLDLIVAKLAIKVGAVKFC